MNPSLLFAFITTGAVVTLSLAIPLVIVELTLLSVTDVEIKGGGRVGAGINASKHFISKRARCPSGSLEQTLRYNADIRQ